MVPSQVCTVTLMVSLQSENSASMGRRVRLGISGRRPNLASTRALTSSSSIRPFLSTSIASTCSGSRLALPEGRDKRGTYSWMKRASMRSKVQSALASPARMIPVSSRHSSREHGGLEHRRTLVTVELFIEAGPMVAGGDTLTVGSPIGELTVENSFTVTTDVVIKVKSTVVRTLNFRVAMCSLLVPTIPVSEIPPNRILPGNSSAKDAAVKSPGPTSIPLPTSASSLNPTMVTSSRTVSSNSTDTSTAPSVTPSAFRNTRTSTEFPASSSACKRPSMSTSPSLGRRSTKKTMS